MSETPAPKDGEEPCAEEALPRLLRRDLDQRSAAESDATKIGEDVVDYDESDWKEEPNEALEDVVDHKVRLAYDEEERHVGPSELAELESVLPFLQGRDEEDEAWRVRRAEEYDVERNLPIMYSIKEINLWWVARGSKMRSTSKMCLK